jgi:predicted HicB family RNase H-like nuclease
MTIDQAKKTEKPKRIKGEGLVRVVNVRLTARDHKKATAAAKTSNQTLTEWIRTMINTSLQP